MPMLPEDRAAQKAAEVFILPTTGINSMISNMFLPPSASAGAKGDPPGKGIHATPRPQTSFAVSAAAPAATPVFTYVPPVFDNSALMQQPYTLDAPPVAPEPSQMSLGSLTLKPLTQMSSEQQIYQQDKHSWDTYNAANKKYSAQVVKAMSAHPQVPLNAPGGINPSGILGYAAKYKGVPYRWGGTSSKTGLDCSGYTQLVAHDVGVSIPRTASSQYSWFKSKGMTVSYNQLKPGDYVYFHSGGPSGWHTGIYAGGGKFWNAPHTGDVVRLSTMGGRSFIGGGRLPSPRGDAVMTAKQPDRKGSAPFGLQPDIWQKLCQMNAAMKEAGLGVFGVSSGFRSYKEQVALHKAEPNLSVPAGQSQHEQGTVADLRLNVPQQKWVAVNAPQFGLNVPEPKREPWHVDSADGRA